MLMFGRALGQVDCRAPGCGTIAELQRRVAERAAETPGGGWVLGRGYDDQSLAERRHPTRYDLDAVAPDHPVVITNASGHLCVANTRALALAGITADDRSRRKAAGSSTTRAGSRPGCCWKPRRNSSPT